MKRKQPMVTDAQLAVLEEFGGRTRELAQSELPGHSNLSILLTRMVRHGWLRFTGEYQHPANGSRSRIVAITELGRIARDYGRVERKVRKGRR
jgi:DNA-binding PadR family transcriptional regulator